MLLFLLILLAVRTNSKAQEFLVNISVNAPTIEGTDRRVFESLQSALYEFMNNRKWTNANITNLERIECTMMLTVRERMSSDEFKGSLNIVLQRPIYKTSYNSVQFNFVDENVQFRYLESQPLEFSDNSFSSNLTAVFAYYAYVMLGLDFDSFSPNGGDAFTQQPKILSTALKMPTNADGRPSTATATATGLSKTCAIPAIGCCDSFSMSTTDRGST